MLEQLPEEGELVKLTASVAGEPVTHVGQLQTWDDTDSSMTGVTVDNGSCGLGPFDPRSMHVSVKPVDLSDVRVVRRTATCSRVHKPKSKSDPFTAACGQIDGHLKPRDQVSLPDCKAANCYGGTGHEKVLPDGGSVTLGERWASGDAVRRVTVRLSDDRLAALDTLAEERHDGCRAAVIRELLDDAYLEEFFDGGEP